MRNYTSSVPAETSITNIKRKLVAAGAKNFHEYYENGLVIEIMFTIPVDGNDRAFKLPARVNQVYNKLLNSYRSLNNEKRKTALAQANRTAWKNMHDWVDLQMTLIELGQTTITEVMFAHMYSISKGKTLFEISAENGLKALPL